MAPDTFETDRLASDADLSGQSETMTGDPEPDAPRRARRSLFQIVCLRVPAATSSPDNTI